MSRSVFTAPIPLPAPELGIRAGLFAGIACLLMAGSMLAEEEPRQPPRRPDGLLECCNSSHASVTAESLSDQRCVWRLPDGSLLDTETDSLLTWGTCPPWPVGSHLLLVDGGVVAGRLESIDDGRITIRSPVVGRMSLPRNAVAGYRGTAASRPPIAAEGPVVDLANGDRIMARSISARDGIASLSWQGGVVSIPLERIHAFDLTGIPPAVSRSAVTTVRVALVDGSRGPLSLFGEATPVDRVLAIRVDGGCGIDLTSLEPIDISGLDNAGSRAGLSRGRTLSGAPPEIGGRSGFSGLGIRSRATIRYRFESPIVRFESSLAIDDAAKPGGRAMVRVIARSIDGDRRQAFASAVIQAGDPPIGIRVDLDQAREIDLVVEAVEVEDDPVDTFWLDPLVIASRRVSAAP